MSMFHELMMRKKEQIMYATIKGSLTESPSGVFSGFSASNYLQTQTKILANESFSGNVRAKVNSGETGYTGIINIVTGAKIFCIEFNTTTSIRTYCYNDTTSSNQAQVKYNIVSADTWFDFYFDFDSVAKTLYISIRNTDGTEVGRIDYTNVSLNGGNIQYGYVFSGLNGSIDLNNSYIKLGSTKYNLQAVVGYTIVGSPTITDGVASGFSSANYLTLPSIPANSYNKIEIKTRVTTENSINVDGGIICVANAYMQGVSLDYGKFIARVNLGSYNALYSGTISANKEYDIICIIDITNANLTLGIKETSQSVYVNNAIQIDTSNLRAILYYIGNGALGEFNGSIDMNETNIKLDNKLWFNGQPS